MQRQDSLQILESSYLKEKNITSDLDFGSENMKCFCNNYKQVEIIFPENFFSKDAQDKRTLNLIRPGWQRQYKRRPVKSDHVAVFPGFSADANKVRPPDPVVFFFFGSRLMVLS